jgi:hypothetical protein
VRGEGGLPKYTYGVWAAFNNPKSASGDHEMFLARFGVKSIEPVRKR